ncbi:LysR family transcriptional regulator [Novosphingobium sp.]|uniref:LysR family transcriptional regulator n=1 Tax=Novosphingobium sp. TaxID=1874826 RepID=UPI003BADBB2A
MKRIALYHFETLLWISRLGTFRAAAERMNTSQPAISARVREIEEQLGIAIFRREGRNMVLTARGRRLVQECEPLWAGFEKVLLTASGFEGASGVVRIGSGEIAAASCLPGFVHEVERDLPGVALELELDLTARMFQQLLAGTIDLAFLAGPVASPGIRTAPIGSVGLVWAASRATVAAGGFARPLPVWSIPDHSPLHGVTVDSLGAHAITPRSLGTCNNVRMLIDIISGGGGAAVLPEPMIRPLLANGTLAEVLPRPERTIRFEAAIRQTESDPLVLELFRRAGELRMDT